MGGMLIREIARAVDLHLVAATDRADSPHIGQDAGEMVGVGSNGVVLGVDPAQLFTDADVVIEQGGDHGFQNYQQHLPKIQQYLFN